MNQLMQWITRKCIFQGGGITSNGIKLIWPCSFIDVSLLQNNLLAPVLGISDPRTDTRIDFVGGIRGNIEIEKLVNDGTAAVGFSMYPVKVSQLMDIADNDQIMPPKSTWFEPKLRSGLFIHTF